MTLIQCAYCSREVGMNRGTWATAAPHLLRWAGLILAAGWLGYYICSGMPQVASKVFPRTITLHAITFAPAVVYAGYLLLRRRLPGGSPLDWPLALLDRKSTRLNSSHGY